jgi:hypothetical protein
VIGGAGQELAYLEDPQTGQVRGYRIGQSIGEARLVGIETDRVVFQQGSDVFEVRLGGTPGLGVPARPGPPVAPAPPVAMPPPQGGDTATGVVDPTACPPNCPTAPVPTSGPQPCPPVCPPAPQPDPNSPYCPPNCPPVAPPQAGSPEAQACPPNCKPRRVVRRGGRSTARRP